MGKSKEKIINDRIRKWKEKLIDLSKRNRLLNFRPTKVTTIKIIDELPPEIFHSLVTEEREMEFLPLPSSDEETLFKDDIETTDSDSVIEFKNYKRDGLEEKHKDKYLQTGLSKENLSKNLLRIYSKANSVMEEQGYNVLFIGLGCLEWYESDNSDVKLKAPIILVPIELTRTSVKSKFKIKYSGEDQFILNPALILKIQRDFGITIETLEEETENLDPQVIFSKIISAVKSQERWRVTNDIYVSLFSFAKFVMYKDIEKFIKLILDNQIIQLICGQREEEKVSLGLLAEEIDLDNKIKPNKTFQILDADSSQQQAILAVKNGKSLVIEGPPGTGKSQTISNIIAEFLGEGKKVLFVSQKMAALEVVKKRLDENNLGDFCLELHSRKTNKKEVIRELARVLEVTKKRDHSQDEELVKLKKVRECLNNYVESIHTPYGELEMTPYQAFGIISSHPDIQDLTFKFAATKKWNKKYFDNCCDILDNLAYNLSKIKDPKQHPWRSSKLISISNEDKTKLLELMKEALNHCSDIQIYSQKLAKYSYFKEPYSILDVETLIDASRILWDSPEIKKSVLEDKRWNILTEDIENIIKTVRFFHELKDDLKTKFLINEVIASSFDVDSFFKRYYHYYKNPFLLLTTSFWKDRSLLKKYFINKKYKPSFKNLINDLKKIKKIKKTAVRISSISKSGEELFANLWKGKETKWETLDNFAKWIVKFRSLYKKGYFSDSVFEAIAKKIIDIENSKKLTNILLNSLKKLKDGIASLLILAEMDESLIFETKFSELPLINLTKKTQNLIDNIDCIDEWTRYQNTLTDCNKALLDKFIDKVLSLSLPFEKIVNIFKCQFLRCWLQDAFSERSALKNFYGEDHNKLIQKFRELDIKQIALAKIRIQHRLSGMFNTMYTPSYTSPKTELGILQREARKIRAHIPIRKLFEKAPNVVAGLKPCLMMSPFTVAQFLNPELINFDLVIFDEASQIPIEDSIGSILRCKQIVIAGDGKQLPPTSFFQSEVITAEDEIDDNEESLEELESILDEVAVSGFPRTMLRWHYRSKHESLIAFSNKNFYDNKLLTFPCAEEDCPNLGIKFHHIPNTTYDRGGSGTNAEEALEIAKAVFKHFKEHPELSLGVGTFSIRQKYAIEDTIEDLLKQDSSLESFFTKDKYEHFFIKNLESIQGDERDVIFISVGYGKDSSGKLPMNFGPINQVGGARRLNVLVTRARKRLEIFTSIRGDDFDLSRTNSQGVHLLKNYLDFAEKGKSVLFREDDVDGFLESPFEESVYNLLVGGNFNVKKQIGCSGYRIDLAILDKNNPGKYILGIECDGANYHSSSTARDRDRLRQNVLENLGWNIYRIWSTDWFRNPRKEFQKLTEAIERVQRQ